MKSSQLFLLPSFFLLIFTVQIGVSDSKTLETHYHLRCAACGAVVREMVTIIEQTPKNARKVITGNRYNVKPGKHQQEYLGSAVFANDVLEKLCKNMQKYRLTYTGDNPNSPGIRFFSKDEDAGEAPVYSDEDKEERSHWLHPCFDLCDEFMDEYEDEMIALVRTMYDKPPQDIAMQLCNVTTKTCNDRRVSLHHLREERRRQLWLAKKKEESEKAKQEEELLSGKSTLKDKPRKKTTPPPPKKRVKPVKNEPVFPDQPPVKTKDSDSYQVMTKEDLYGM